MPCGWAVFIRKGSPGSGKEGMGCFALLGLAARGRSPEFPLHLVPASRMSGELVAVSQAALQCKVA